MFTSTLDLADELFGALRFPADVPARGQALVTTYAPGLPPALVDRAYRRFSAFLRQAENYYRSAKTLPFRSSALLYYYSFMNLAKAALAARAIKFHEHHGLEPRYGNPLTDLSQLRVRVEADGVFQALYRMIFARPIQNVQFQLSELLAYVSEVAIQYIDALNQQPKVSRFQHARLMSDAAQQQSWLLLALPTSHPINAQPAAVRAAFAARFQRVTVNQVMARDLFDLFVPASLTYDYYQSYPPVAQAQPNLLHVQMNVQMQYIRDALPGCVHQIYVDYLSDFILTVHSSALDGSTWPMNELCAIYLSMFFVGSLVRYRPYVLDELLGTSGAWLLESFVSSAPLLFLRTMACFILNRAMIFNR